MHRCLDPATVEGLNPFGACLTGGGGGSAWSLPLPLVRCVRLAVPLAERALGRETSVSDLIISSGESRTAESTITSVMRCNEGETSAGFHCSSSTNFADCVIRA